jgi:hypothetical protein
MRPTTAAENRKYLARAAAWTYLVASCTDKANALIERCKGDPFMAWSILKEKCCATDVEENHYPELDQVFSDCKLVGTRKDPELWFNDLDQHAAGKNQLEVSEGRTPNENPYDDSNV